MNNPKSAMTAGALGIFLGAFGAHDWYLGNTPQARNHVRLFIIGVALLAVATALRIIAPSTGQAIIAHIFTSVAAIFNVFGWLVVVADAVWGFIAGILLLVGGDQALAAQGHVVASMVQRDANGNIISINPTTTGLGGVVQPNPTLPTVQTPAAPASSTPPATTQAPTPVAPTAPTHVTLPPAPTLAEQGSNTQTTQPIVFRSSDIPTQPTSAFATTPPDPNQPITTQNVTQPGFKVDSVRNPFRELPTWARRLTLGAVILIAASILAIMIKNGIDSTLAVAYQESYRAAKAIQPEIKTAHDSSSCTYVAEYAQATTVDRSTYNGYISTCKKLLTGTRELVERLGETPVVRTDRQIAADYATFLTAYDTVFVDAATASEISATLDLYQTWHSYLVAADRLTTTSSDSELQQAADILRTSGHQTLAVYGEEWYLRETAFLTAYRAYQGMSYTDPAKEQTRLDLDAQLVELTDWVTDHRPNITKLAPYAPPDTTAMYQSFTKLYDAIKTGYEKHYNVKSGDCNVAGDKVYCS